MDHKNMLHTKGTYWLVRGEYLALLGVCSVLLIAHAGQVHWIRGLFAFWIIDFIGYIPGAIIYRRKGGAVPAVYYYMYNFCHTYLVVGLGVGLWALALGGFEWAMLAVPIHLSIDRGVFGNVFKPLALPFEPSDVPLAVIESALGRNRPQRDSIAAIPAPGGTR